MRTPLAWLRDYVDLPADAEAIAQRLAMLGFPVDHLERRPQLSGIVVGRITRLEKHPNADRLQVASVDIGGEKPLTIATAATNVGVGQTIPVAVIGARLPELSIEPRTMRGIASEGMMCSADELALPAEWFEDGIMQFESTLPLGTDVVAHFGLNEPVLDVEVTGNRVDALSMLGLARELGASYGATLRLPSFENPATLAPPKAIAPAVDIRSPDCRGFITQRFTHVENGVAPTWMRIRLALAGQRPIDRLVDISNFVMLEVGQPLHFYDAQAVAHAHFIVRDARSDEKLETLDDLTYDLNPRALVIADADGVLGLAGLKGGKASRMQATTTSLLLESATFSGARIRSMSRDFGLRTEASARHEKTLPPILAGFGAARAAQLLTGMGATAYLPQRFGTALTPLPSIRLHPRELERLLGLHLDVTRIQMHLQALGCSTQREADALLVTPPAWRNDLAIAADLVEEVARMEGYDRIEAVMPKVPIHAIASEGYRREEATAQLLAGLGYDEVMTFALHGAQVTEQLAAVGIATAPLLEVANPLSEDQRYLRASLAPGLIAYLARDERPRRGFEIGHIFTGTTQAINEQSVAGLAFSLDSHDEPDWRDEGFLRMKGDLETLLAELTGKTPTTRSAVEVFLHPGKSAALELDGAVVAHFGRIDPRVAYAYGLHHPGYVATLYLDALPNVERVTYRPPSKYPSTYRDLALLLEPSIAASDIETCIAKTLGNLCTNVRVFDEYRGARIGEGVKGLAVRVILQRSDATITDDEADAAVARTLVALEERFHARLRT